MSSEYSLLKIKQLVDLSKKHSRRNIQLNKKIIFKIIEETWKKTRANSKEEAFILIVGLLQTGGSNKNAINRTNFAFGNAVLSSKEFTIILSKVSKNITLWQFAWYIANDIAKVSLILNLEGDLSSQIKYEYPTLPMKELIWCSSFQTTNPYCPSKVRNWLVKNYRNKFNR